MPVESGGEYPLPRQARRPRGLDPFKATVCFLVLLAAAAPAMAARALNGFVIEDASVPRDLILSGGPPRDGIPALTDPALTSAEEARYLRPDDVVLGIYFRGTAKAYPTRILTWHEIVNDSFLGNKTGPGLESFQAKTAWDEPRPRDPLLVGKSNPASFGR